MSTLDTDRRRHPRELVWRPCKIHEPRSGKYYAGTVVDFSAGGMLLSVPHPLGLSPGDTVHVGVAQKRRQILLRSSEMVPARIARCMITANDETLLGVQMADLDAIDQPISLQRAA